MKKLVLALAASLLVTPAFAEFSDNKISLGCTPIPKANEKPDGNPTTRVNVDIEPIKGQEAPSFAVLHELADGGQADRWHQYAFDNFSYYPAEGSDKPTRFIFFGRLRVNPRQMIAMQLWAPPKNSVNAIWFYQEFIGRDNEFYDKNLKMPKKTLEARCYEEGKHNNDDSSLDDTIKRTEKERQMNKESKEKNWLRDFEGKMQ